VIAGRRDVIDACARHPLARALRAGGLTLAVLQDTALAYLRRDGDAIPFWRMATAPVEALRARAEALDVGKVVDTQAVAGAGSLPGTEIASVGIAIAGDHTASLRAEPVPIIARVRDDTTICDLRTVDATHDAALAAALRALA
jgi:L-seryl-tRNA(Ser) seleniumtransferase